MNDCFIGEIVAHGGTHMRIRLQLLGVMFSKRLMKIRLAFSELISIFTDDRAEFEHAT